MLLSAKQDWFGNIRGDILAGIVVALALVPEAIAFSIIAGVDPKVGLYASFAIAVMIAFVGGRAGMISAATAATALLMVTLVKDHGLYDGNKRVASTVFLEFLNKNKRLFIENKKVIEDNTLVALVIMIAESNPKEKELMVNLVMKFLM